MGAFPRVTSKGLARFSKVSGTISRLCLKVCIWTTLGASAVAEARTLNKRHDLRSRTAMVKVRSPKSLNDTMMKRGLVDREALPFVRLLK